MSEDLLERLKRALSDRYAVEAELEQGGMAVVYLARELRHDREVAITVLHPFHSATLGMQRFLREIDVIAKLVHPNILTLIDSGVVEDLPHYVMPVLKGQSLAALLQREEKLAPEYAMRIACAVAEALQVAHRQGIMIIHRDIKPSNVQLRGGHAVVTDFGVAAAALLTLFGASLDVVMEDYHRSNDNIIPVYQEATDAFVAAGGGADIPLAILGVKAEYLESAVAEMEARCGTIEYYFAEGLGIDAEDAPPEARAAAERRGGRPVGQALEALTLHFAALRNREATPAERALALSWVMHIVGDIHQPMHVSDLFSRDFPEGNAAATLSYVGDPLGTTIPLHVLWDSNVLRTPHIDTVSARAEEFIERYPRTSIPELANSPDWADVFEGWARESHQEAIDWAYGIETVPDPNAGQDAERLVANMIRFILEGISPVEEAPPVPDEYWERLQEVAAQRITLAGYRIADLVVAAADHILAEREFIGRQPRERHHRGSASFGEK